MNVRVTTLPLISIALLVFLSSSCGEGLVISMNDQIPPTFSYKGNRFAECCTNLNFFVVSEFDNERSKLEKEKYLWWIWPNEERNGEYYNLPEFTYGKVPEGWRQTVPEQGEPPQLIEGKTYVAGGNFGSGQDAHLIFTIRNGKAVWLK